MCRYYQNKQCHFGHYIDKDYGAGPEPIRDELSDDNNMRPGRYLLLQQQEARVLGTVPSSLDKASELKALFGERSWQHVAAELQAQGASNNPALLTQLSNITRGHILRDLHLAVFKRRGPAK